MEIENIRITVDVASTRMQLFILMLLSSHLLLARNIYTEVEKLRNGLKMLKSESSMIHEKEESLLKKTEKGVQHLSKVKNGSETVALGVLRRNDIAFDMVEQDMARKMH